MHPYKENIILYLSNTKGCNCCISRKLVLNLSMKKRPAYGGANLVPIAVPETCLILLLNSNKLFFNTNSAILTKSVGIHILSCLSKAPLS